MLGDPRAYSDGGGGNKRSIIEDGTHEQVLTLYYATQNTPGHFTHSASFFYRKLL
jgi:hypothetical protein